MSELGDDSKNLQQLPVKDYSRRDFGRTAIPLGAGALWGIRTAIKTFFDPESYKEKGKFSDLKVDFRIGMHAVLPEDLEKNTVVIGGETFDKMLFLYFGQEVPPLTHDLTYNLQALKTEQHISTTASDKIVQKQRETIKKAAEEGVHLIVSDNRHFQSVGYERIIDSYNLANERHFVVAKVLGTGVVTMIGELAREINNIRKGGGFTENNPLLGFSMKLAELSDGGLDTSSVKEVIKAYLKFQVGKFVLTPRSSSMEAISNLGDMQRVLVAFSDKQLAKLFDLIEDRSLSMALGFQSGQKMLDSLGNEDQKLNSNTEEGKESRALYFCGTAHANTRNFYEMGPKECGREVYKKVQDTVETGIELIDEALLGKNEDIDVNVAKIYWILSTSGFSYPMGDFMKSDKYLNTPMKDAISSARSILWSVLYDRLKKEPDNHTLNIMIKSLAQEDIAYMDVMDPLLPQIRQKAKDERNCQLVKNITLDDGSSYSLRFMDGMPVVFENKKN